MAIGIINAGKCVTCKCFSVRRMGGTTKIVEASTGGMIHLRECL